MGRIASAGRVVAGGSPPHPSPRLITASRARHLHLSVCIAQVQTAILSYERSTGDAAPGHPRAPRKANGPRAPLRTPGHSAAAAAKGSPAATRQHRPRARAPLPEGLSTRRPRAGSALAGQDGLRCHGSVRAARSAWPRRGALRPEGRRVAPPRGQTAVTSHRPGLRRKLLHVGNLQDAGRGHGASRRAQQVGPGVHPGFMRAMSGGAWTVSHPCRERPGRREA